ncbi:DUF2127 domain-containing protein [Candidatus Kaiserbacteria bacterium]|nr:DUF2127 domain-containing protein [Candidatus Kaiserbacteria bacterium]
MDVIVHTRLFVAAMWWRICYGLARVLFGLALLKVVGQSILEVVTRVMEHELIQDSSDLLFSAVSMILTRHPLEVTYFLALYFIFWGVLDAFLSFNLLRHRLWAFPVSLYLIGIFVLFSTLRLVHTHSLVLLGVIVIDIGIFVLIYQEYNRWKSLLQQTVLEGGRASGGV